MCGCVTSTTASVVDQIEQFSEIIWTNYTLPVFLKVSPAGVRPLQIAPHSMTSCPGDTFFLTLIFDICYQLTAG